MTLDSDEDLVVWLVDAGGEEVELESVVAGGNDELGTAGTGDVDGGAIHGESGEKEEGRAGQEGEGAHEWVV